MRLLIILTGIVLIGLEASSQTLPIADTVYTIHKKEKQSFQFSISHGYTLRATIKQMGIDVSISIYKKGDTARLAYVDSPNGEYGTELVEYEADADGDYMLVVEPIDENTVSVGRYSIHQRSISIIQAKYDTSFASGSQIALDQPNPLQIENLSNLGMVWGFLKYYHPAVARGDYNWDAALFRIMPKIISAKTKKDANAELEKWVDSIGKPDACSQCDSQKSDSSVQISPDYTYLFNKENLGNSLVGKLNYIKENRNQDENYYVGKVEGIGNPTFDRENGYDKMNYPDAGYRLLCLYRYWNIIQYFFPYKYVIGENWNKVLAEFIPIFVNAKNATSYSLACLQIIARIHDTHANIWRKKELKDFFGQYAPPIQAKFIESKLVLADYYTDSFSIREKLHVGDIIAKIDDQPVDQMVKDRLYLVPASNYETQMRNMPYELLRSKKDSIWLELIRDNKKISVFVHCIESDRVNLFLELNPNPNDSSYRIINGNIGYIFPGRYHDSQLERIKKTFENTIGMIIDMRTYPSEFMPFTFGAYIKPGASPFVKFTGGDVNYPGMFRFTPPLSNGEPNTAYYKGPIVELVNSLSQSQAEYTTMAFQTAPDITVIGSTTAGADGNVSRIPLPGGISTYISGLGVFYPDGTETQRKGIKINIIVKPTIEGIKKGKDEVLDRAIEIINSKNKHK